MFHEKWKAAKISWVKCGTTILQEAKNLTDKHTKWRTDKQPEENEQTLFSNSYFLIHTIIDEIILFFWRWTGLILADAIFFFRRLPQCLDIETKISN